VKRKGGDGGSAPPSPSLTPRLPLVPKSFGVQIAAAYRAPGSKVPLYPFYLFIFPCSYPFALVCCTFLFLLLSTPLLFTFSHILPLSPSVLLRCIHIIFTPHSHHLHFSCTFFVFSLVARSGTFYNTSPHSFTFTTLHATFYLFSYYFFNFLTYFSLHLPNFQVPYVVESIVSYLRATGILPSLLFFGFLLFFLQPFFTTRKDNVIQQITFNLHPAFSTTVE
jgi:hypothetical protein